MAELTIGFERRLRDVTAKRRYSALTKADDYNSPHQPVPAHALPPEFVSWSSQIGTTADRYLALVMFGPSRTGKTALARQIGPHLYFRGSVNYDRWELAENGKSYCVFDDVDWSAYSRDQMKAILSGQSTSRRALPLTNIF